MADLSAEEEAQRLLGAPPAHHAGAVQPLAPHSLYATKRTRADVGWSIAYLVAVAFGILGGAVVLGQAGRSTNLAKLHGPFLNHSLTCDATKWNAAWDTLYHAGAPPPPAHITNNPSSSAVSFDMALGEGLAVWLPVSILVGLPFSMLFVHLFKKHPLAMVKASLWGMLGVLFLLTAVCLGSVLPLGLVLLFVFAVMAALCWAVRNELELCAELLGVSSRALGDNIRLIPTVLAVKAVTVVVLSFFMITTVAAFTVGKAVPYSEVLQLWNEPVDASVTREVGVCYDRFRRQMPCCEWQMGNFAVAYIIITYLVMGWTLFLAMQVKQHIVANLIAQWYYAPPGATQAGAAGGPSLQQAVHHTLVTGFGTASFAAVVLFLVSTVRRAIRNGARRNLLCMLINCVVQPILAMLEMYTKFASIAAAITGKPFVPAARDMLAAFKRCFLATTTIWWVPDFVTGVTMRCLALAWAVIPFMLTGLATDQWLAALMVAIMSFMLMVVILGFSAGVLMDIVNTVYVLFAMDRDAHVVTRPDVHQVFQQVAAKNPVARTDAVVHQPDGDLGYGRAEEGRATPGHAAAPPASVAMVATSAAAPVPAYSAEPGASYGYVPPTLQQQHVYGGRSVDEKLLP